MKLYTVEGNISGVEITPLPTGKRNVLVTVKDIFNDEQAPVMLHVYGQLEDYVDEVTNTDSEEKYMTKRFTYDDMCYLQKIEVLKEDPKGSRVVKTIEIDTPRKEWANWIDE